MTDHTEELQQRIAALEAENERITRQREAILLQARCWAGEAKAQQSITKEVGEILGGIPSWGPIAAEVRKLLDAATTAQEVRQEAVSDALRKRFSEIENEVARGKHNAMSCFTAMRTAALYTPQPGPDVRGLAEALESLASGARTINQSQRHQIMIKGDDEPCFWQRREWVEYLISLCDEADKALASHRQAQRQA